MNDDLLPPPPWTGGTAGDPFAGSSPWAPPPQADRAPGEPAAIYDPEPPRSSSPGTGRFIATLVGGVVLIGAVAVLAVLSFASEDDDDRRSASTDPPPVTASTAPEAEPETFEMPEDLEIDLPPLEHDLDVFGPTGTCVAAGTYANVSCEQDHAGEVFARLPGADGEYPGEDELQDLAFDCEGEFLALAGESSAAAGLAVVGSQPSEPAWGNGLREVVCLAMSFGGVPNVGSIADG
jgi:hypothetical protein